jgi:outer membrane biosynthesis protein TonB
MWTAAAGVIGFAFTLAAAGCAGVERAPSRSEPAVAATTPAQSSAPGAPRTGDKEKAAASTQPEVRPAPAAAESPTPVAAKPETPVPSSPPQVSTPAPTAGSKEVAAPPAEKPAAPPVAKPAPPAAPTPAPVVAVKPVPSPAAKPAANPPLDLTALEKRLKETSAIGVFTKLTLKNQVDELLDRFKAHYEGRIQTTLVQLRQPYDLLMLKVLSLLQDGDPSLARAITESREAIWGILSDPNKFKNL